MKISRFLGAAVAVKHTPEVVTAGKYVEKVADGANPCDGRRVEITSCSISYEGFELEELSRYVPLSPKCECDAKPRKRSGGNRKKKEGSAVKKMLSAAKDAAEAAKTVALLGDKIGGKEKGGNGSGSGNGSGGGEGGSSDVNVADEIFSAIAGTSA